MAQNQAARNANPTCLYCDDVIDASATVIASDHDGERETSLEREPELATRRDVLLTHTRCAPAGWREP